MKKTRKEWVIHIWGKRRDSLELTDIERFHFDMICMYDISVFDRIVINIAMDDILDDRLFRFLSGELSRLFSNADNVEIFRCENDRKLCEAVTFKPYVLDRIGEDVRIFYSHFKGYNSNVRFLNPELYPTRNRKINEFYWSYLMYRMNLSKEYMKEMDESFDSGKDVYCWCLIDRKNLSIQKYYKDYFNNIRMVKPDIDKYFDESMLLTHSPGSFIWYNMKSLDEHLGDRLGYITDIDIVKFGQADCARHLCELYIWQFLNSGNVMEQTIIKNMNDQWLSIGSQPYMLLFFSKRVCNEYAKDFEGYLIDNGII